jgi:hypothetical protein
MATPYVIDTPFPTLGPWRETPTGNKYASVTFADGRKFYVGIERDKMVRIAYKPRGQNRGWRYYGWVNDAAGKRVMGDTVPGSLGVRGLLKLAKLI